MWPFGTNGKLVENPTSQAVVDRCVQARDI
jgi:hypothetical protein